MSKKADAQHEKYLRETYLQRGYLEPKEYRTVMNHIAAVKNGENVSLRQSAIAAGYSKPYATTAAKRIGEMMSQNEALRQMMEREGLGLDSIVKGIKKLSEAKLPPNKFHNGHDDNFIQMEAVKLTAKIQDVFPTPTVNVNERKIVITLTGEDIERARKSLGPEEARELDE